MSSVQKQSEINLLPQEEFASSTLGRTLTWLLSTFRVIVIFTEIIVMGVFLSRFWLDAKANDLNELLKKNQAVLGTTAKFENEFRNIQNKLDTFAKTSISKTYPSDYINQISENLPADVYLTSLQISDSSIQIKGNSVNEVAISQFIENLKKNKDFSNIALLGTNTSQKNISVIEFSLKINFSSKGKK